MIDKIGSSQSLKMRFIGRIVQLEASGYVKEEYYSRQYKDIYIVYRVYVGDDNQITFVFNRAYVLKTEDGVVIKRTVSLCTIPTKVTPEMLEQAKNLVNIFDDWGSIAESDIRSNSQLIVIISISCQNYDMSKFYTNNKSGVLVKISSLKGSKSKNGISHRNSKKYYVLSSKDEHGHVFEYFDYVTHAKIDSHHVCGTMQTDAIMLTSNILKGRMFSTHTKCFKSYEAPKCIYDPYHITFI